MGVLQVALRTGVVLLFVGSAGYGLLAGWRRWRPCTDGFDTPACLTAQSHETANLAELASAEAMSFMLLGSALLLLALLGRLPIGWRLVAMTTGPVCWSLAVVILGDRGKAEAEVPSAGGYETTLLDAVTGSAFVVAPLLMVGVGLALLSRPRDGSGRVPADRTLGYAWLATALGWPIPEYSVLQLFYASHDAPPGTGLLRSALAVVAAVVVLRTLVVRRCAAAGHAPSAPAGAAAAGSYPGSV